MHDKDIVYVHTSDGMRIRHYIDSISWEYITNTDQFNHSNILSQQILSNNQFNQPRLTNIDELSCYRITAKVVDVGSANITSVPAGAKIFIDYIGDTGHVTPYTITNIPVGPRTYKLTYPGYMDTNGVLFIELNQTYDLSVIMEKTPGFFDPTALVLYTLGASVFMVFFSQRGEEREPEYKKHKEKHKEKHEKKT